MVVLDEQLLGRQIEQHLARWYRGRVVYIMDLRPGTVIKDDAIPVLLRQHAAPTFVTINETDFWQRIAPDPQFCIICCALPDSRTTILPLLLRQAFRHPRLRTKTQRMGLMVRLTTTTAVYYTHRDPTLQIITI